MTDRLTPAVSSYFDLIVLLTCSCQPIWKTLPAPIALSCTTPDHIKSHWPFPQVRACYFESSLHLVLIHYVYCNNTLTGYMFTEVLTVCIGFQRTLCILEILVEAEQPVGFLALDHSENGLFTAYWSMGLRVGCRFTRYVQNTLPNVSSITLNAYIIWILLNALM